MHTARTTTHCAESLQCQRHSSACYRTMPLRSRLRVASSASGRTSINTSLFKLPLFSSRSALLPTCPGRLLVYEPHYLQMFKDMEQAGSQGQPVRFGHIISRTAAPPHLLQAGSVQGYPKVGVLAEVKHITHDGGDGTLQVTYEGRTRFQILSILDTQPYTTAYCMHLQDQPPEDGSVGEDDELELQALEQQVYAGLLDVVRLSNAILLDAGEESEAAMGAAGHLPAAVTKFAPPLTPHAPPSLSDALIQSGYSSAGHSIAMWQSQGSVYGHKHKGARQPAIDPYQMAAEQLSKAHVDTPLRQELFSFACAACLELENPQRLALLNTRDTRARLAWVHKAVQPYWAELQAKAALSQALASKNGL